MSFDSDDDDEFLSADEDNIDDEPDQDDDDVFARPANRTQPINTTNLIVPRSRIGLPPAPPPTPALSSSFSNSDDPPTSQFSWRNLSKIKLQQQRQAKSIEEKLVEVCSKNEVDEDKSRSGSFYQPNEEKFTIEEPEVIQPEVERDQVVKVAEQEGKDILQPLEDVSIPEKDVSIRNVVKSIPKEDETICEPTNLTLAQPVTIEPKPSKTEVLGAIPRKPENSPSIEPKCMKQVSVDAEKPIVTLKVDKPEAQLKTDSSDKDKIENKDKPEDKAKLISSVRKSEGPTRNSALRDTERKSSKPEAKLEHERQTDLKREPELKTPKPLQPSFALDRLSQSVSNSQRNQNLFDMVVGDIKRVAIRDEHDKSSGPPNIPIPQISIPDISSTLGWGWSGASKLLASASEQVTSQVGSVITSVVDVAQQTLQQQQEEHQAYEKSTPEAQQRHYREPEPEPELPEERIYRRPEVTHSWKSESYSSSSASGSSSETTLRMRKRRGD